MKNRYIIYLILVFLIGYFIWSQLGRQSEMNYKYKPTANMLNFEKDSSTSNIIGIQAYMTNLDYRSEESFFNKLDYYLSEVKSKHWIGDNTIVVFPEHIATWLVAVGEKKSAFKAQTINEAMEIIVLSNLPTFLWKFMISKAENKTKDAIFQLKGFQMAVIYQEVFSELARKYKVNIVAGSILLPNPRLISGKINLSKGPLYNTSAIFNKNGEIEHSLILKKFPTLDELTFCAASKLQNKSFKIDKKKIGVMICADSWYPKSYKEVKDQKASVLVVPAYSAGDGLWGTKWKGYSGFSNPKDIDDNDIGNITEGEAWHKYTLTRCKNTNIKLAVAVFLRGHIWDLGTDGQSFIWNKNQIKSVPKTDGSILFNIDL